MRTSLWVFEPSLDGLQIRSHDICHAADFGVFPEVGRGRFPLSDAFLESLQCHVQTDFVPILETVNDGLGRMGHPDRHAVKHMGFNSNCVRRSRKANNPNRKVLASWIS